MCAVLSRGSSQSDTPQRGRPDNEGQAGTPRAGGVPLSTWPRGDLAQPGGYGLLVTPRLPPSGGARLGGGDGVRLRGACETLGGRPDRDAPRAPLLGGLGGNRHCRQTYLPRGGLSTPLGPTRAICFRPDVEVAKRSDRRWGRAGTRGRRAPRRACKNG